MSLSKVRNFALDPIKSCIAIVFLLTVVVQRRLYRLKQVEASNVNKRVNGIVEYSTESNRATLEQSPRTGLGKAFTSSHSWLSWASLCQVTFLCH